MTAEKRRGGKSRKRGVPVTHVVRPLVVDVSGVPPHEDPLRNVPGTDGETST